MIDIHYREGVFLPAHNLWLDPHQSQEFAFVSHAHADHIGRHREVILSANTARLMRARLGGERVEHILDYDVPTKICGGIATLLPAGHIFGSAQLHFESGAGSFLYTGDFKLRHGKSAEPARWQHADTLIMETTFGLPRYVFPPAEEILADIRKFCLEAIEEGDVPILLGYSLGKAQEILASLTELGLGVMLHPAVYKMTKLYREMVEQFPPFERLNVEHAAGKVLICPPNANRSVALRKIKNRRVAMLSGWAMTPGAVHRYQCDAAFPLSDHADYPDLIRYVELVQPKRVLTLHGYASEFAADLRARGIEAWALTGGNQLELAIPMNFKPTEEKLSDSVIVGTGSFSVFTHVVETISKVTGKNDKIRLLANFLGNLDEEEASLAALFLTGRPFAQSDPRVVQVGSALIRRAVSLTAGISEAEYRARTSGLGDIGKSVLVALQGRRAQGDFTLLQAGQFFSELEQARGPSAKTQLLTKLLNNLAASDAAMLIKVLTGDLRIGLKEGLVEESIAETYQMPLEEIKEANMLTGDLALVCRLARKGTLPEAEVRLFHPIKAMLASPEPTAEAVWGRFKENGASNMLVEDKYDGIRAQIHVADGRVEIYSRDLRPITHQFPELVSPIAGEMILDGEILAYSEGRHLTFFDLQKRLGRKGQDDLFMESNIPVVFTAFDLLYHQGRSLMKRPLLARRAVLESLALPPGYRLAEAQTVHSAEDLELAFRAARARRNEGLMVKDASSVYLPGRRGMAWFKLKKELTTLDVVVIGVEQGHGKRSHVLSDYTFAVRDEATDSLLTIGKAYSGLSDVEIEELTTVFESQMIGRRGRLRLVEPTVVLEIAFDSIQPSSRHNSGLALRFPRIKAIRQDKTAREIDTVEHARSLVGVQFAEN